MPPPAHMPSTEHIQCRPCGEMGADVPHCPCLQFSPSPQSELRWTLPGANDAHSAGHDENEPPMAWPSFSYQAGSPSPHTRPAAPRASASSTSASAPSAARTSGHSTQQPTAPRAPSYRIDQAQAPAGQPASEDPTHRTRQVLCSMSGSDLLTSRLPLVPSAIAINAHLRTWVCPANPSDGDRILVATARPGFDELIHAPRITWLHLLSGAVCSYRVIIAFPGGQVILDDPRPFMD
jgi:hypothetical protein